jgi:hypothetical protein
VRRAIVSVLTGVVLLAGIVGVRRADPDGDRTYEPIATSGVIGQQVNTTTFQLRVDRVELAGSVRILDGYGLLGTTKTTAGIWVVVWATVAATTEEFQMQGARLRTTDGVEYLKSTVLGTLDKTTLQPGIPAYGPILFEIPRDKLAGAVLSVTGHGIKNLDHLGPAVDVDLGLSGSYAKSLVQRTPALLTVDQVREL